MNLDDFMRRWAPTLRADAQEDQANADLEFTGKNEKWEETVADTGAHTGVMVAFYPTPEQQQEMAVEGGEPAEELHLTLAFLGEVGAELTPEDEPRLIDAVAGWASGQQALSAVTNGHGIFAGGQTPVTYASIDSPALPALRQSLVEALDAAGLPSVQTHGYVPHLTLSYDERRDVTVPAVTFSFDEVVIAFAGTHTRIRLGGAPVAEAAQTIELSGVPLTSTGIGNYRFTTTDGRDYLGGSFTLSSGSGSITATDRPVLTDVRTDMDATPAQPTVEADTAKAFVTDINGRTLITGPATTIAAMKDPTVEDITAEHMLWMHGNFVGADAPNRNGALWSAGDLEMAKGTVTNGPLNWLHDARHIIGTLAKADYINPAAARSGMQVAAGPVHPHITATAAIWRWIYPDEAYVIQQASDQQMLWYSMECISKEVSCVGEAGCGNKTTYADYMAGAACEHVMQRASVRRFDSPVFLGGAVIVPPTRPGWAEADARVMTSAVGLAEAAFEQAGRPDVSTSDWEQLMAQLVTFAHQ